MKDAFRNATRTLALATLTGLFAAMAISIKLGFGDFLTMWFFAVVGIEAALIVKGWIGFDRIFGGD